MAGSTPTIAFGERIDNSIRWSIQIPVGLGTLYVAQVDGRFAAVFQVPIPENNNEAMDCGVESLCFSYEAEIALEKGPGTGYPDIRYTVSGTRLANDRIVPFNQVDDYAFDGQQYVRSGMPKGQSLI